jgi:hypothetical protein
MNISKNFLRCILVCLSLFLFIRCSDDEKVVEDPIPFKIEFTESSFEPGRSKSLGDVSAALITLTDQSGNVVLDLKKIAIYQYGNSFVTESILLKPARYNVTGFMLVDENDAVQYATPVKGSDLDKTVDTPLPINFVVGRNNVKNVALQVVPTDAKAPSDFGYVAFGIEISMAFQLSPMLADNNTVGMTGAHLQIVDSNDSPVYSKELTPSVNLIKFTGDDEARYTLRVEKEGYGAYTKSFVFKDLASELNGNPLDIIFKPAMVIVAESNFYENFEFEFGLVAAENVTVDWGDGTRENIKGFISHTYSNDGLYTVTVTGNLNAITGIQSSGSRSGMRSVDVTRLVNLETFEIEETNAPSVIDLQNNHNMKTLKLERVAINQLLLAETHNLTYVSLDESQVTSHLLDYIIDNLYSNTYFRTELYGGYFSFEDFDQPIAEPSEQGYALLTSLKDDFNWTINPDIL